MSAIPFTLSPDELALRLQQQRTVADFGLFALSTGPLQRLLDEATRVAAEGLQVQFAKVLRYRPDHDDLLVIAGVGWHAGVVGHSTLGSGLDSPAGFALHTGQPTVANHLAKEDRFRVPALLAEHGVQSAINVVIGAIDAAPFGVLEVDSSRRHDFLDADTAFLQSLANVLAAGLARIEAETAKDALLKDKDLLMREVHHRVSNSLQLVRTMLGLQSRGATEDARIQLDAASGRIMSIAAVHRRLYQGGSVAEGDAAVYLQALVGDMREMLDGAAENREIVLDAAAMVLPADSLTPLGLVVSELVTNAIKYGVGRVVVRVARVPAGIEVTVEDEGDGFGPDFRPGDRKGLGMRLIASLAKGHADQAIKVDRAVEHGRVSVTLKL